MPEKNRILAVDDDPMNLFLLTEFLKKEYDIITAASGEEALDMVISTLRISFCWIL